MLLHQRILMTKSALPERLQQDSNWVGTDWDTKWQRWMIPFKAVFAYGPRAKEWWARWKTPPKILLRIGDKNGWRWEMDPLSMCTYVSRVQYFKRWHFAIHWPLLVTFHCYFKKKGVPMAGDVLGDRLSNTLFYCYFGAHYDQDGVYWMPSVYVGLTWK